MHWACSKILGSVTVPSDSTMKMKYLLWELGSHLLWYLACCRAYLSHLLACPFHTCGLYLLSQSIKILLKYPVQNLIGKPCQWLPRKCHTLNTNFAENNSPPVAVAGPDKELTFPVESTTLDGSKSQDDQGIVFYHWENIRYPKILLILSKIEKSESDWV